MPGFITRPFAPVAKGTVSVNATGSSTNTTVTSGQSFSGSFQVYNQGANDVWLEFGDSTAVASTTQSMPLKAGTALRFSVGKASHIATIVQTPSSTVYITPGEGI